jgi:hypothetical protein
MSWPSFLSDLRNTSKIFPTTISPAVQPVGFVVGTPRHQKRKTRKALSSAGLQDVLGGANDPAL